MIKVHMKVLTQLKDGADVPPLLRALSNRKINIP
jgi:hypothetical protein